MTTLRPARHAPQPPAAGASPDPPVRGGAAGAWAPGRAGRLRRELHPVAWWCWSVGLAAAASFTLNPVLLLAIAGVASAVVVLRRSDQPWSRSFRIYLWLAAIVVAIRVVFRVLLGGGQGTVVWLDLPEVPLPPWVLGIQLLGPVTQESVLAGLYDGMRLAAILLAVGAANALANPRRLLASLPPALYEIGTALVVAVSILPQLGDSLVRVRRARRLRPGPDGRFRGLRRTVVPVLEDALDRSLRLAAGMDVRGYGRSAGASPRQRALTGALMLTGLLGTCVGVYAVLDRTAPRWLAQPMLLGGVLLAVAGMASAGRRVRRTRYRPARWRTAEILVAASGLGAGVVLRRVAQEQPLVAYPDLLAAPSVTALALGGVLLALLPALVAPPPPVTGGGR